MARSRTKSYDESTQLKEQKILNAHQSQDRERPLFWIFLLPGTIWLVVFFLLPLALVLISSLMTQDVGGGVVWQLTLENYQRLNSSLYIGIIVRSLWLGILTTGACLVIGYPLAFFLAQQEKPWRNVLLLLIIIPFWTNFLVRTYAWIIILGKEGVINTILSRLQIIDQPLELLFTPLAVAIGLTYGYLPFMVLPIYSTLEQIDVALVEAARDLGANELQIFLRIIFPLTLRGMIAGCLLVFIPAVSAFVTPDILGGAKTLMVGNLIQNQYLKSLNWPFGSALSMVLIILILIPTAIYLRIRDDGESPVSKSQRIPGAKKGRL